MPLAKRVRDVTRGRPVIRQSLEVGWKFAHRLKRPVAVRRYQSQTDLVRVMLGAGPAQVPGWLATDLLPTRSDVVLLDASKRFPFATGTVDRIHAEHMVEHIDYPAGQRMLAEIARVLRPGGRVRISTPDFDRVVALVAPPEPWIAEEMRQANLRCGVRADRADEPIWSINRLFSAYDHRFLYSEMALHRELLAAGFGDIRRYEVDQSDDPEFIGVDRRGSRHDATWMRYVTMVLEATR